MTENDESTLINWATVTTNVTALLIGSAVLATLGGGTFLIITLPRTLDQVLKNQASIIQGQETLKSDYTRLQRRLEAVENSNKQQDQLIYRMLGK